MGLYIEPADKLGFATKGTSVPAGTFTHPSTGKIVLAWADNGPFQSLAIIYSRREAQRYTARTDALWFEHPVESVRKYVSDATWRSICKEAA